MKKIQFLDTRRNISKQFISFLSIAIVAMLAVAAYLGINFASDALIANASKYMDRLGFRDIEVTSTMLLTEDDLEAIKAVDGVVDAEGVYQVTAKVSKKGQSENDLVDVISITERISLPDIIEGRLPETFFECAVEEEIMEQLGLKTGDTVMLSGSDGDTVTGLRHKAFRITGSFVHADHYAKKTYSAGNRYILVTDNSFDQSYFENCRLKAVIRLDRPDGVGRISKGYDSILSDGVTRLEALADECAPMREKDVKDRLREEIDKGQEKLDAAKKELDDGRKELDENTQKIADGEKQLAESLKKLEKAHWQLAAAKKELDDGKAELDANKPKLDSAKAELDEAKQKLADGWNTIEGKKTSVRNSIRDIVDKRLPAGYSISWSEPYYPDMDNASLDSSNFNITSNISLNVIDLVDSAVNIDTAIKNKFHEAIHRLLDNKTKYDDVGLPVPKLDEEGNIIPDTYETYTPAEVDGIISQIENDLPTANALTNAVNASNGLKEWNKWHDEYISGRNKYLEAKKQYDGGLAAYEEGLAEYQDGYSKYDRGLYQYNQGVKELEDAKVQLAEGEEKYAEGLKQYEEGLEELQKAKDTVAGLNPCRWIVLDAYGSPSYVHAKSSALNIRKMAMTFAMLFVLIGALVVYATVARIIDEQRKQLGTVKALGLYNREAAVKYLVFGISATLMGVIMGTALGYFVIQWVALMSHETFYVTDGIPKSFNWTLAGISAAAGATIALLSVWSACAELVKLPAVELMKEKMPEYKGKVSPDKAKRASLYSKLIMRNMRNDVRRIFVTVISVAGCCILLVIGFTMKSGIINALERQYNELLKYDQVICFDTEASETAEQDIRELLDVSGVEYTALHYRSTSFNAGKELNAGPLICTDQKELDKNFELTDITTGKPLTLSDHGIYITRRIAVYYHINVGDTITIYDSGMNPYDVPVAGIYQYYFGTNLIMSENAYREVFEENAQTDGFMLRNCPDIGDLSEKLSEINGFESIESNRELYNNSSKAVAALNIVVIVLILAAGIMAYFILLNLANMYINQKRRELTIMRVNGYTTRETIAYVAREAVITTALGIILGVALGSAFGYAILRFIEQRQAGFILTPNPTAWLLSAWITAVYSFIIYAVALRKVKHLKLTDIA